MEGVIIAMFPTMSSEAISYGPEGKLVPELKWKRPVKDAPDVLTACCRSVFGVGMRLHFTGAPITHDVLEVRSGTIGDTLSGLMGYTFGHHALEPSNPDGRDYSICYAGA